MQSKRKSKSDKLSYKTVLIFLGLMLVAYLPVSSFLFFIKNDAFGGYFPAKFFISEGIHHNNFPWWNPYINFGIPQYGDMNSGFYSPITWLFASFFHYNAYSFTAEILIYLFLSGLGMYQLSRTYKFTKSVSYIAGAAYMCSGYMIGHLQHFNWISGAAFLPWAIWGYHHMVHKFSMKNVVVAAIMLYLFVASAHPGLIIGAIYFFISYIGYNWVLKKREAENAFNPASFIKKHLWLMIPLLLLSMGLIYGYADIIPHMTRGKQFSESQQLTNAFTIQSLLSVLLPMATVKASGFFMTDISMRNIYFGLIPLFFLITGCRSSFSLKQKYYLGVSLFFFFLSLGGPFDYLRLHVLPLMGHIRMPGELSLFVVLGLIIFSSQAINNFITEKTTFSSVYHRSYFFIQLALAAAIIAGIIGWAVTGETVITHLKEVAAAPQFPLKLKKLIDSFSIFDLLVLQSLLQLFFLRAMKEILIQKKFRMLIRLVFIDMIVVSLLNLPFTGVGQASVAKVQTQLNRSPEGIPTPFLIPVKRNHYTSSDPNALLLGDWTFYNKQIGTGYKVFYPVELSNTGNLFNAAGANVFAEKPFIFNTNDTNQLKFRITNFKTGMIDLIVETAISDTLVLQQNYFPRWTILLNGEYVSPIKIHGALMGVALKPGKNDVKYYFAVGPVETTFNISKYVLAILLIYLIILWIKRSSPS